MGLNDDHPPPPQYNPAYPPPPPPGTYPPPPPPGDYLPPQPPHGTYPPPPVHGYPAPVSPIPGIRVVPPVSSPLPGQVITRYVLVEPETGCCRCEGLNIAGIITILALLLLGLPCFVFIPCLIPECFEKVQSPVYEFPPNAVPTGAPPPGY